MLFIFCIYFLKVLLNSSILLHSLVSIFMTIPLNYLSVFFFSPFVEVLSCLFIWKVLISSSFCLIFCVYFYVLGTSVISPSFERMTLCRKCYVGPSRAIPLITRARCSRGYPLDGFCVPISCGWVCLLWVHSWAWFALRPAG